MSWWSSVVNGVVTVGTGIGTGLKWVWDNASLSRVTKGVLTYSVNTGVQALKQVVALRKAIPALINKSESRKILDGMAYVAVYDVLPIVSLNFVNNTLQTYCRSTPYVWPILTLVDWGVTGYTWRQGAQSFIRITALDALGPPAFHANSSRPPVSLCLERNCNTKRRMKGILREPFVLIANDLFVGAISNIPYVGYPVSRVLRVFFNGRYITRLATPELCERHKFQFMMQESILELGLAYEANKMLMDYVLELTIGMPPYLYYRTMSHLLLLFHVNLAAHLKLPLIKPENATLPIDPLNIYEGVCRFIADVVFAGLVKRVPIDFQFDRNAKPLIPLTPTLRLATRLLKSDLEIEQQITPGFFNKATRKMKVWVLPPILQGADGLINDPILAKYWPTLRQGAISSIGVIQSASKARTTATLAWAPKTVATALYLIVGVPKKVTKILLMLSQEEEFLNLADALKAWFERHNVRCEVVLVKALPPSAITLHGDRLIEVPKQVNTTPLLSAAELLPVTTDSDVVAVRPEELVSVKSKEIITTSANPASLFTTRRRGLPSKVNGDTENLPSTDQLTNNM